MRSFTPKAAAAALLPALALAAPLSKRQYSISDADILNYALTLEHLEATFYAEALNMYNAGAFEGEDMPDWVRYRFTEIANEEFTHVETLTAGLKAAGATPVAACKYNFGIDSIKTFIDLAGTIEGVGVSAYLGAAPYIQSSDYLALAGAILVVEAEHQTWIRSAAWNEDPFPRPFSPYLDFSQVYTLVAPFFVSCPASNPTLPVKAFPVPTISTAGPYYVGQTLSVELPSGLSGSLYATFVTAAGATYQSLSASSGTVSVTIPDGITGQSYLLITDSMAQNDNATVAGPVLFQVPVQATDFSYCVPGSTC